MNKRAYIVAVSGGVDSVCLLHKLVANTGAYLSPPKPQLIVAHFDHGIRKDSANDRHFVANIARCYGLEFVYDEVRLGSEASEDMARQARYSFLNKVLHKYNAEAIITAHHQDDVLETAVLNLVRGTYRRGLASLRSGVIIRPLLSLSKEDIYKYAEEHNLDWREDSTNLSDKYLRNYIRRHILSKLSPLQRYELLDIIDSQAQINQEVDIILSDVLPPREVYIIPRLIFTTQSKSVARQLIAWMLTSLDNRVELTKSLVESIFWFVRSARLNKHFKLKHIDIEIIKGGQVVFKNTKSC